MSLTLSPPVRNIALCMLAAAITLGGGLMLLGHKQPAPAAPHAIKHHPFGAGAAAKTPARPAVTKAMAKKHASLTTPAAAKPVAPRFPQKPSAEIAALNAGLPGAIARALGGHQVVVVALYNPQAEVDGISFAEARAGAMLAGVGFAQLNVLSQVDVGKLTETLGVLPDPGLLVYTRPGTLAARIDGFADRETVAQAAQNAAQRP